MSKITRGVSKEFAKAFKECELYELYQENKKELIIGVRNNYLNIYYNCDSIAVVKYNSRSKKITCKIDRKYIDGISRISKDKDKFLTTTPNELIPHYRDIKKNSNEKSTNEKKAQSKLYILNNYNKDSNWFCIDVEYVKAFKSIEEKKKSKLNARFDIIAISKSIPHKVALIELKYGSSAIGGASGVYKHIHDFSEFIKQGFFESQLQEEIIHIIESQINLGIQVPFDLPLKGNLLNPEFFFITLDNVNEKGSTPKQTMSGYLFNDGRWDCKKISRKTVESEFGDVTKKSNSFSATFLFSEENFDDKITISDIIDGNQYERIEPK